MKTTSLNFVTAPGHPDAIIPTHLIEGGVTSISFGPGA